MANDRSTHSTGDQQHDRSRTKQGKQAANQSDPQGIRDTGEGLLGDTSEDRNLSGSTTWRTLPNQGEKDTDRPEQEFNDRAKPPNPPNTTTGHFTAPKFGSAGSGGAELEPGPERD